MRARPSAPSPVIAGLGTAIDAIARAAGTGYVAALHGRALGGGFCPRDASAQSRHPTDFVGRLAPRRRRKSLSPEARFDRRRAGGARCPDGPGQQGLLGFRVDGRVSLSSRAQRPALDLGHRRLLVPWHRARRRGADRRHVGDERLSPRSHGQDDRPQRPHVPARGRDAAHRLRRGDGEGQQGSRRHFGAAAGRGPGVRELSLWLVRRAGARHSRKRSRAAAGGRRPYHSGFARRLRCRAGRGGRLQACGASEPEGRRQDHHHRAPWRGDAVRRHAAHEVLYGRRHFPDRHDDLRQHLHLHAARRGADLLQPGRAGERHRGLCRRSRRYGRDAAPRSSRRRGGR